MVGYEKVVELKRGIDKNNICSISELLDYVIKEDNYDYLSLIADNDVFELITAYICEKRVISYRNAMKNIKEYCL